MHVRKYGNKKITVDGVTFDSKKEYMRWCELCLLEKAGQINGLRRQVKFDLIPEQYEEYERYEAIMAPRSSTFKNYGILMPNSIGVIDESFKGEKDEWHCLAYATRNTVIHEGDRICQFRIIKHQPKVLFQPVKHLKSRSRGGIGSTGRA